jgi:hypothetical protein
MMRLISDGTGRYHLPMNARMRCFASLLTLVVGGCSSNSNNSNAAATPAGALPCTGLAIDCRMAFADTYNGTYQGSATGTFTLHVDVLGGIQGSGPGIASIASRWIPCHSDAATCQFTSC